METVGGLLNRQRMNVPAAKERRQRIEALLQSEEWQVVRGALAGQQRALAFAIAAGERLPEAQIRRLQGRYGLLTDLLVRPVEFLLQYDEGQGDERG
jgi:hypothetical protein